MRILDKYLYKELFLTFLAVLIVLLLITFGSEVTQLLAKAVEGKLPASIVLDVLALKVPAALELILPLVALLSVMLALGRLYQDQEMVVLNSCGIVAGYFQRIVTWFLLPLMLLTAVVTLWLTPWAAKQERLVVMEAQTTAPVAGLVAGRFNELPQSNGVLYATEIRADGSMRDIWIRVINPDRDMILTAPQGQFEWIGGRLALVLRDGFSYEGLTKGDALQVRRFERFDGFLPELESVTSVPSRHELTTLQLLSSTDLEHRSILQWRLAVPLSVLVLGLLALKLSKTKPREGRFARIFFAIVLYVFFMQSMLTMKDWIKLGQWPPEIGLWPIPIVFLMIALWSPKRRLKPGVVK